MTGTGRIFITGGASGLGRALAVRYQAAGYQVAIADRVDDAGTATAAEIGADYYHADVTRIDDLERVAQALLDKWGGVDIVVNNA
ncbi:MAG TPA: SDR family NAD(P)-dependent oxidoreductase, partial [Myxococcota bacterium]